MTVGEKKALAAVETGIHRLMQTFDPENLSATTSNTQVDSPNDPNSFYSIGAAVSPTSGPSIIPMAGFAIGGGNVFLLEETGTVTFVTDGERLEIEMH
jgi:hypothetical protein